MTTMKVKKALNPGAVRDHEPWLVICCNVEGNRILQSDPTEERAMDSALTCNEHDQKYGHRNQYIVRHRNEVEIMP